MGELLRTATVVFPVSDTLYEASWPLAMLYEGDICNHPICCYLPVIFDLCFATQRIVASFL